MPKPPPNTKIKRAEAFVDDAGRKVLTPCGLCGEGKYIAEGETVCDECKGVLNEKYYLWKSCE